MSFFKPVKEKIVILNLTQHIATPEQREQGVMDLPEEQRKLLIELLTVVEFPTNTEITNRCENIATLAAIIASLDDHEDNPENASGFACSAMIGGAPWMMSTLERALMNHGIEPLYAFSVRESVDQPQPDGSVRKEAMFRHQGFIGVTR